ncbi:stage II sporulation protein M [Peribacillus saganii]|uniref:Stage II sporulation protein M n=1 Tax=Peribacillus saganii TaxID=2303992 RepID=A0A372LLL0_9BACI|nr:stage II sporulation protein M [Peribacillus saganii]RFU67771.1 stage II sporulation protein M [Peribacillus saganii]
MKQKNAIQAAAANHIRNNSSIYIFITVLFLMGVIFGAVIVNSLSFTQKEDLFYYLSQFFGQVSLGKIAASPEMFIQSLSHNVKYIGVMWILGVSIIGLPIILLLLFLKGMVVGFTVGFLVNQMGWNGLLLSFVAILPQNIIVIPVFILIAVLSVSLSIKLIKRVFIKQLREPLKPVLIGYFGALAAAIIFLTAAGAMEAYVSPVLMKNAVSLLAK